jgi:UDP-N-acetylmuramoyl-L-alanine---L-glutamate ligase
MKELIKRLMVDKQVAILGFGREGRSTYRVLRDCLPGQVLGIIDENEAIANEPELKGDSNLRLHVGKESIQSVSVYDIIIKAPGVPTHVFPAGFDTSRITSQTSLFLERYSAQVIGITGTKGKSTTSSLVHHILSHASMHSILLGNIGLPPFEGIPEITPKTKVVMELSSHQLEYLERSPHIAVLLNIFQEHLDHYSSYEAYQQAKMNIGKLQTASDYFIYCADNLLLSRLVKEVDNNNHKLLPYSLNPFPGDGIFREDKTIKVRRGAENTPIYYSTGELNLKGEHNFSNIIAATAACYLAGASPEQINAGVDSFKGLEHRIEYVGEYDGVIYYNDSIATIPEATIEAVKTLNNVDTLILGGYDRGIDYGILYPFLASSGIGNLIFIGAAGKRMQTELTEKFQTNSKIFEAVDYQEVVSIARKVTGKGKICLLSPAASSYDMFKNFEHRGNIFKKNVRS